MSSKKKDSKVAATVKEYLETSRKSQVKISDEMGLENPNLLSMFKSGRTKLPVSMIEPLAKACGRDYKELAKVVFKEYFPELDKLAKKVYQAT